MNECPTRVRTGSPPCSRTISGTACEVIRLWMIVVPWPLASSRTATSAVIADGLTGSPRSSTTNTRSASPSNASPMSAPCSRTAACRSTRLAGSSGLASWLGKEPSSSKYSGTISRGSPERTTGTVCPPMPLPASTTTFSGRMPERSTSPCRCAAYPARTSLWVTSPTPLGLAVVAVALGPLADGGQPGVLPDRGGAGPAHLDAVVLRRVVAGGEHRAGHVQRAGGEVQQVGGAQARPRSRRRRG